MIEVLPVEMQDGPGGVHVGEINAILPAHKQPDWCLVYVSFLPDPIMVKGDADEMCVNWQAYLQADLDCE